MKKLYYLIIISTVILATACKSKKMKSVTNENPLLSEYNTPFEVPPFDRIKAVHYMPAFKEGMLQQDMEIKSIIENKDNPTFENTVQALDYSGRLLVNVSSVFFSLTSANTNDDLQKLQNEITPLLTKHNDDIFLNSSLFKRIKTVYDSKSSLNLNPEQIRLLEKQYHHFLRSGAGLDSTKKDRLRAINELLASLSVQFNDNVLEETKAFNLVIKDKIDLAGLPKSVVNAAAEDARQAKADGTWLFTLDNASIIPFLTYSENRNLREKILKAYMNRANNNNKNDNKKVFAKLVNLRSEKALILGYKNFAEMQIEDRMSKTPGKVFDLLNKLWTPALEAAKKEASEYQQKIYKDGKNFKLEPWDWRYYAEKVRKEKFEFDEEQVRQYFTLENVKQGAFTVANKLYGITFTEIINVPKYHPENVVYEVKDKDGSHLGVIYMDFHPRKGKRGGAWCTSFRDQYRVNGKNVDPIVSIVCNFTKPLGDEPALLSFDEARTLFHEFGHALQGIFSKVTYPGLNELVRDYVELPSQIMENWASDPQIINMYAKNYKTGKPIPKDLLDKISKSEYFGEGFATTEYLAASFLDLDYHTIAAPDPNLDIPNFENNAMKSIGLIPEILPRYRTTYFLHISDDEYAAGYYVYVWAQVLDADAFSVFKEKGLFDQHSAQLFRENVLEKGGSEDEMEAYKRFRGKEPDINALLKRKGFINN